MPQRTTRQTTRTTPAQSVSGGVEKSEKNEVPPVWPYPHLVERRRKADPGLTPHMGSRQWSKQHKGKRYYFGSIDRPPEEALAEYQRSWPGIVDGRGKSPGGRGRAISVRQLLNQYVHAKAHAGVSPFTVEKVRRYVRLIGPVLGLDRDAESLGPEDFARLRYSWKSYAPNTVLDLNNYTRSIFKWAAQRDLIEAIPNYGPDFRPPRLKEREAYKEDKQLRRSPLITPETFASLLDNADAWMRAVLLISMNCGFGPSDLAIITPAHIRLRDGWLDASRAKNRVARLGELWPETLDAIRPFHTIAGRKDPIFTTRGGHPIAGDDPLRQPVKNRFDRLRVKAGCENHVFYDLRRTFSTVALHMAEPNTVKIIMGHTLNRDITMTYVQRYPKHKIRDACRFVRSVMLGTEWKRARETALTPKAAAREIFG